MEACVGAHHLSRRLKALGHDARLMPAKYVRPYSKGQKNDFRDAEAIAEAVQRPTMKFVATKTADQLDLQALHRVRERSGQPAYRCHQSDPRLPLGAWDRGAAGATVLACRVAGHSGDTAEVLSPRMVHLIEDLAGDWRRLDERIEGLSGEIEALARQDAGCERLMSVPGIGPIISSAMVAAIGAGDAFTKGRDFAAWLGLVPKTDLDGRPHGPWQDIQARQSLPARPVRSGGLGRADQVEELGALWAQALDRGGQEAAAPQCAGDRARQQAGAHRLERSRPWPRLRGEEGC